MKYTQQASSKAVEILGYLNAARVADPAAAQRVARLDRSQHKTSGRRLDVAGRGSALIAAAFSRYRPLAYRQQN
jgi:hypothetical protein